MVDVLGISLVRLLAVCQERNYDYGTGDFKKLLQHYQELENETKGILFYRRCPTHRTWLQPQQKPFPQWQCWHWQGCSFIRIAKLRTAIERKVFEV